MNKRGVRSFGLIPVGLINNWNNKSVLRIIQLWLRCHCRLSEESGAHHCVSILCYCSRSLQVRTHRTCFWRRGRRLSVRPRRRNTKSRCQSLVSLTLMRFPRRCVTEHQINQTVQYSKQIHKSQLWQEPKRGTCLWRKVPWQSGPPIGCLLTKTMPTTCKWLPFHPVALFTRSLFSMRLCVIFDQNC